MIKLFPESKRPWSDAPSSFVQDYRNPYEIYFGLFGGGGEEGDSDSSYGGIGDDFDGEMGEEGYGGQSDDGDFGGGGMQGDDTGQESSSGSYGGGGGGASDGSAQAGDTSTSDAETDDPATAGAGSTEAGYSDETGQMGTPGGQLGGYQGSTGPGFGGYAGGPGATEQATSYASPPDMTAEQKAAIAKAFVTNTKGMPISTPNSKGKFGGYLGKENATDKDISGALSALAGIPGTPESKAAGAAATAAASGVPVGIASSPSISAAEVLGISPVESMARFGTPGYAGMTAQAATNTADQFSTPATAPSVSRSNINTVDDLRSAIDALASQSLASKSQSQSQSPTSVTDVVADSLDRNNPNAMAAAETDSLLGAFGSNVQSGPVSDTQIGIAQAPSISAAEVLGVAPASTGLTSTGLIGAQGPPGMVSRSAPPGTVDFSLDFPGTELDSTITGTGSLANALDFAFDGINSTTAQDIANARAAEASNRASVASPMSNVSAPASVGIAGLSPGALGGRVAGVSPGQLSAEQLAAMDLNTPSMVDAETDVMARDLSDMNRAGYTMGLPDDLDLSGRNVTAPGAQISTNLAGLTREQAKNQPLSMDIAQLIGSNPYGYEIDPQTGQVIGQVGTPPFGMIGGLTTLAQDLVMGPPQNTQDLIERGAYTGMTGQDNDGIGAGGGEGSGQPVKAPNDPCPAGYQMVNGACQISDDLMGPLEPYDPGSNFVINPITGLPTLFQPTTQATQVGPINPFVLQPYPRPPVGINPPGPAAASGIQALSPTGAALGRAI